ncbi:hypothetical protein GCM10027093_53140 [Paraburkholderia jirisanensis]
MLNFLLGLFWSLALLAVVLCICCALNYLAPHAALDGCRVFALIALMAACTLAFDSVLTFVVFADAQQRYGRFSTGDAFAGRALAYASVGAGALCAARWLAAKRKARSQDVDSIEIARLARPRLPS